MRCRGRWLVLGFSLGRRGNTVGSGCLPAPKYICPRNFLRRRRFLHVHCEKTIIVTITPFGIPCHIHRVYWHTKFQNNRSTLRYFFKGVKNTNLDIKYICPLGSFFVFLNLGALARALIGDRDLFPFLQTILRENGKRWTVFGPQAHRNIPKIYILIYFKK